VHFEHVRHQYTVENKNASKMIRYSAFQQKQKETFNTNPINVERIHHLPAGLAVKRKHATYCCRQETASMVTGEHNKSPFGTISRLKCTAAIHASGSGKTLRL